MIYCIIGEMAPVIKNVIAPIQAWLMSQGQCVGCGMPLRKGMKAPFKKDYEKVTCRCGRIFIRDIKKNTYRRALLEEV